MVGDRVFVTCYSDYGFEAGEIENLKRHLLCIAQKTGKLLWQKDIAAKMPEDPWQGPGIPTHGYASSTPASDGNYHYHATKTYPYINGGVRGEVTVRGDQVEPQPRDQPIRPAFRPLRDAKITGFQRGEKQSVLTYTLRGQTGTVTYYNCLAHSSAHDAAASPALRSPLDASSPYHFLQSVFAKSGFQELGSSTLVARWVNVFAFE